MLKQKHNLIALAVVVFFIPLVFIGGVKILKTEAATQPPWPETNVSGWSWVGIANQNQPHIGWFSNNCYNSFSGTMQSQCSIDYGLKIDFNTGNISGYSWNAIVDNSGAVTGIGWIDFNPNPYPSAPNYPARIEPAGSTYEGQISGWARFKALKDAGENLGYSDWGWILLGPEPSAIPPFGVQILGNGRLQGYAWSAGYVTGDTPVPPYENLTTGVGWISFGHSSNPNYPIATYDEIEKELQGWAWIGNNDKANGYLSNIGWIALNCENGGPNGENICAEHQWQVNVDKVTGQISGYAWVGESQGGVPIGWIDFAPNPFPDWPNFSAKFFQEDPPPFTNPHNPSQTLYDYNAGDVAGWARIIALKEEGEKQHFENWGWVKLHPTNNETGCGGNPCNYGVSIDFDNGKFSGYAWSGGGTVDIGNYDPKVGLGWISFEDTIPGLPPTYVAPFLETQRGDIFATEGVGTETTFGPPGPPLATTQFYNATFMIQSGGDIVHFTSSVGEERGGYDATIEPPLPTNRYTNVMGKLDVQGITAFEVTDPNRLNKFGNHVEEYIGDQVSSGLWPDGSVLLKNNVYHIKGNLTIDNDLIVKNGHEVENPVAAGTVVVDGDLNIQKNISYDSDSLPEPKKLVYIPSAAWIVKGNVNISPSVINVDGAFIIVGRDEAVPLGELDPNTGKFYSGGGQQDLDVSGLIIAYEILLQRSGIGTLGDIRPSERVIYDGRVIVNTPPGLSDFAAVLPVLREVAPIEVTIP